MISRAARKQRKAIFVEEMLRNGGNQTKAAEKAGYKPGAAAERAGCRLVLDVDVSQALTERRAKAVANAEAAADTTIADLLKELKGIVYSDLRKCFDKETGALLPPHKWPDDVARAMSSVKVVEMAGGAKGDGEDVPLYTKEVRLWDKNSAIEKLMKHLGLFEKDNEQKPTPTVTVGQVTVALDFDRVKSRAKTAARRA